MRQPTCVRWQSWLAVGVGALTLALAAGYRLQAQDTSRYNPLRAAYMRAHFNQALAMHDAIARGDLPQARVEATILSQRSPTVPMPVGAEAFQGALTQAARDAANATTLDAAAQSAATVFGICGQCHQAMRVRASVPASQDVKVGGLVGHMLLHQHGSDALIEGLVAPSETQWVEGVRTFASPKLESSEAPGRVRSQMRDGEAAIAVLAGHAAQAQRTRDRAEIYGRLLAACGTCHQSVGGHAGPRR